MVTGGVGDGLGRVVGWVSWLGRWVKGVWVVRSRRLEVSWLLVWDGGGVGFMWVGLVLRASSTAQSGQVAAKVGLDLSISSPVIEEAQHPILSSMVSGILLQKALKFLTGDTLLSFRWRESERNPALMGSVEHLQIKR